MIIALQAAVNSLSLSLQTRWPRNQECGVKLCNKLLCHDGAAAAAPFVIDNLPSRISRQNMANGSLRGSMRRPWLQNLALILLISARRVNEEGKRGEGSCGGSPIYLGACLPACPLSGKAKLVFQKSLTLTLTYLLSRVSCGKVSRTCFSAIVR